MRILIISDIHGNLVALDAVLAHAEGKYDEVWFLGDLIGYGPDPEGCVERVRGLPGTIRLVGNHDKAVLGEIDINTFNSDARTAIRWTQRKVSDGTLDYLRALPASIMWGDYTLAHASPRQPIWEYILDRFIAQDNFNSPNFATRYCFVGHTHIPVIYREVGANGMCTEEPPNYNAPLQLDSKRVIINPGSVGQPRDNDPRAAYALLDTDTNLWQHVRVEYSITETQKRMRDGDLPTRLIARLEYGW